MATNSNASKDGNKGQIKQVAEDLVPKSEDNQQQERAVKDPVPWHADIDKQSLPTSKRIVILLITGSVLSRFSIYVAASELGDDDEKLKAHIIFACRRSWMKWLWTWQS